MPSQPRIICLTSGIFQENCYLVASETSSDAILIDPGEDAELFLSRLNSEGLTLKAIWLTHGHLDHVDGVQHVVTETGAEVYLHPGDRELYDHVREQGAMLGIRTDAVVPPPDRELAQGDELRVGDCPFCVLHVPGHSPGGVAFLGDGVVICGDTLFAGSIGRSDLPGGDMQQLLTGIRQQLLSLPDDTVVYPGHGPETTIGVERASNPFLRG